MPGIAKPTIFDDMPTKRPHFFSLIVGRKYFALKKWESKFVANVFRHVARSNSSIERLGKSPALFTTISTSPTSRIPAAAERHCSSCITSSCSACAVGPILRAVSCGGARSVAITCAPRSANANAIALPMPWPAPVTNATRPSCVLIGVFILPPLALACSLECCRPPEQIVYHDVRLLLQLGEALLHVAALEMRPKRCYRDVNGRPNRRHLNLDCRLAKLLDGSRTHGASVAHKRGSLAVPLRIDPIDRVFQYRGGAVVVLRRDEYKTIRGRNLGRPSLHYLMFVRRPARHRWRHGLLEERHGKVAEVEKLRFHPLTLAKLLKNPLRRFFGKPALACAADDH